MKHVLLAGIGIAVLATAMPMPAHAGVSADFAGCDGMRKPKRSDDGMRGEATLPAYGMSGNKAPRSIVAACDRALASGKLREGQDLRRAHMYRARAAANLELGNIEDALTDLDRAEGAGAMYREDYFYQRSMGLSLDMLRALALHARGEGARAVELADQAAAARPFALNLQRARAMLRAAEASAAGDNPLASLVRIDPEARSSVATLMGLRRGLPEIAAEAGAPDVVLPALSLEQLIVGRGSSRDIVDQWATPVAKAVHIAYALASVGDGEAARAWLDASDRALSDADGDADTSGFSNAISNLVREQVYSPGERLIKARIAVSEGRLEAAHRDIAALRLRRSPVTEELHASYAAAVEASDAEWPALPSLGDRAPRAQGSLMKMAGDLLLQPESERKLIDYKKSRPNILGALIGGAVTMGIGLLDGIPRTSGFKEEVQDDGSVRVTYTGNTTSGAVVQEMTLLRAAEVARDTGKARFVIDTRKDYQRYLAQLINGAETSRSLAGYMTVLTISFPADDEAASEALEAVEVIDTLGPIYYDDKA